MNFQKLVKTSFQDSKRLDDVHTKIIFKRSINRPTNIMFNHVSIILPSEKSSNIRHFAWFFPDVLFPQAGVGKCPILGILDITLCSMGTFNDPCQAAQVVINSAINCCGKVGAWPVALHLLQTSGSKKDVISYLAAMLSWDADGISKLMGWVRN